jgi:tetratricopeptide (TPR) repeat protein
MKLTTAFTAILIIPLMCFANPQPDQEIDELIVNNIFSGDWAKADSLLETQINKHPDNPKYYTLKGQYYFYTRYYNNVGLDNDSLIQKMGEYSLKAVELGEQDEMTLDDKFFVGTAYGYLSRYYIRFGAYWDTYRAASNCQSYLEEVLDEDPSYADAKMGIAVIEYFTSVQMNSFLGFVAWVAGVYGSRDSAMMNFHDVADNGYWFKDEAKFALTILYSSPVLEYDVAQARALSVQLHEKYPQNTFITGQYNQMRFLSLVEEKGVGFLESEFDSLRTTYEVTNAGILNGFGYNLLFNGRFEEAIVVLNTNMKLFPEIANCYDSLSEAYLAAGNPDMAIYYSQRCLEKLQSDTTINEGFRNLLRTTSEDRIEALGGDSGKVSI